MSFWKQQVFPRLSVFRFPGSHVEGIAGTPFVYLPRSNALITGDLHLGEYAVKNAMSGGGYVSSARVIGELVNEIVNSGLNVRKVVFNGDIKHVTWRSTREEKQDLYVLINMLGDFELVFLKGNHDERLRDLLEEIGIWLHVRDYIVIDEVLIAHGHDSKLYEILKQKQKKMIILAHEHLSFVFQGLSREKVKLPAIAVGFLKTRERVIILPSSNPLTEGSGVRHGKKFKFLSPLLREHLVEESLEFYPFDFEHGSFYVPRYF